VDRRRFVIGALGAGSVAVATPWLGSAGAATEDELAFANFGASTELLVKDFYSKALAAKVVTGSKLAALKRGRSAAGQHAKALSDLLTNAGDVAPLPDDFEFEWPTHTFKSEKAIVDTGRGVLRPLLGAYQTAVASASDASYRVLYASLTASVSQQLVALAGPAAAEPFPTAMDLEAASDALEAYLG
jgi:hypothetical protein